MPEWMSGIPSGSTREQSLSAELKVIPRPLTESVNETLERARGQDFDTVIVLGFKRNQGFITSSNWRLNRMELLGALEYAKHHVWES